MLAAACATASSAEETMLFNFLDRGSFSNCTQTSVRYDRDDVQAWSYSSYSSYITMSNYNISYNYYDDYLVSPDIELEAGCQYVVYCRPSLYSTSDTGNANMDVLFGQGDNVETYTTLKVLKDIPNDNYSTPAPTHEAVFLVPESGNYRVAFRGYPSRLYLKEAKVCSRGASSEPMAAQNFKAVPDADGELKVEVSFDMPTSTLTGQPLTDISYNLYRGVQKIKNGVSAAPGETVTYSEARGEEGVVVYSVEILSGENVSEKLSVTTYVGAETPLAPADVTLGASDNDFVVTWSAPTEGTHGAPVYPEKLSYSVSRILDGNAEVVAENLTECTFSEVVVPEGIQSLQYSVTAIYGKKAKQSEAAASNTLRIGSIKLPFSDSFAGAQINALWDNEIVAQSSNIGYPWKAVEKVTRGTTTIESFDGDGGLGCYNSYNIMKGNSARLATPSIDYSDGDSPVLTFAMYHLTVGTDQLKVQVSCDYGEWIDVPDAEFTPKGTPDAAWSEHSVDLGSTIPAGTKTYRVGLLAVSAYGQDIVIDDVRIFNQLNRDLAVSVVAGAESVNAGKSLSLNVKVSNNGSAEVKGADYSLDIITDYPDAVDCGELLDIPSLGSVTYAVEVPFNSLHAYASEGYDFAVQVKLEGDEASDNDRSDDVHVAVAYGVGKPAADLAGTRDEDGNVTLSWTAAKDLEYIPVAIVESFEDEAFEDDFTGPFNGWTVIDLDGRDGGNWYSANGSIFNLCKNASTPGSTKDGKNLLGVTVASNVQQDDWIISPRINCRATSTMTLEFLFGMKEISSYGNKYTVELLYTTDESYDILNPQTSFTSTTGSVSSTSSSDRALPQDNKMHPVVFEGIPGNATYVALHFAAKGSYTPAMWVDNIRLTENDENPLLGYHVYDIEGGARINDELLPADATSFAIPSGISTFAAQRNSFVSAVYPDGEARPSNLFDIYAATTGVESVAAGNESADARFYNLNGVEVNARNLTPGIYIRRAGSVSTKVVVR